MATVVYVVVAKDREGKPRGFEKSSGRLLMTREDAERELKLCPAWLHDVLMVQECIIMSREEYDAT